MNVSENRVYHKMGMYIGKLKIIHFQTNPCIYECSEFGGISLTLDG